MSPRTPPGLHKRQVFEPQCTHLTMARLYSPEIVCGSCHCPGPFGWLYQCTQDRDDLIEQTVCRGEFANMDEVGCCLTAKLGMRHRSPAAREDRLSFFKEITQEQLANYHPNQVASILRQRENVHQVIEQETVRAHSTAFLSRLSMSGGLETTSCGIGFQKPWICSPNEECRYLVCHHCRPGSSDRAFLSLNAIANGEIPPSAAAGYGFHLLGQRPVVKAEIVMNLGCRPITLPQSSPTISDHDSPTSTMSVMDLLDAQITRGRLLWAQQKHDTDIEDYDADFDWSVTPLGPSGIQGRLKHSPGCENLGLYSDAAPSRTFDPLLWTPPPSPGLCNLVDDDSDDDAPTGKKEHSTPSKVKHPINRDAEASPLLSKSLHAKALRNSSNHLREPSLDETPHDSDFEVSPTQPSLAKPEETEKKFTPSPLKVPHGVAMLEESVELGVPDVITQA